ncbi:metal-sulfur cluster biosynthetic enzyme [Halobacteriales archaeon QS_1_68_20]|nr:MAG: metal-sulfur cluster biosynthetic enzyme [Halobacteriales archaeon QS_1_68_20]
MSSDSEEDRAVPDPGIEEEPTYCPYTTYEDGDGAADLPATGEDAGGLEAAVWDALYAVEDPEMPISVVDLGLIYGVEVQEGSDDGADGDGTHVRVDMTLTYTGCPARDMLTDEVREAAASPEGVDSAAVRLVWSPEWNLEMVTEAGKADLREFGLSV